MHRFPFFYASVKLSVVGYGRKTQEGGDTLGGRSAQELSTNITKLNQALTNDATIRHIHLYDGGLCWVLKGKLEGAVFDISLIFSLE
jgi:hypothetical protein